MPKRTSDAADEPAAKAAPNGREPRVAEEDEGMGEFEDRWEDDIESESGGEEEIGGDEEGEEDGKLKGSPRCLARELTDRVHACTRG